MRNQIRDFDNWPLNTGWPLSTGSMSSKFCRYLLMCVAASTYGCRKALQRASPEKKMKWKKVKFREKKREKITFKSDCSSLTVRFGRVKVLCSWAKHFILPMLSPPGSINEYQKKKKQGNINLPWTGIPSRRGEGVAVILVTSCHGNLVESRLLTLFVDVTLLL